MEINIHNSLIDINEDDIINGVLTIPEGVKCIYSRECFNKFKIKELILPKSLKGIYGRFIINCTLEEITIPEDIQFLVDEFLECCLYLKKIKIY
jgi:hypothetical protein